MERVPEVSPIKQNDILFAHKALNIAAGLSEATRRVAGAIIDHFNRKTGQCDPSINRLAELLTMSRESVLRATRQLHEDGWIERIAHGGHSHRTAYLPNWEKFNALVATWDDRMRGGDGGDTPCRYTGTPADTPAGKVSGLTPSQCQDRHLDSVRSDTQTNLSNQSNKPIEPERRRARDTQQPVSSTDQTKNGLRNGMVRQALPPPKTRPPVASRSASFSMIAEERAKARWDADLRALGWQAYGDAIEHITEPLATAATQAEVRGRGGGMRVLLDHLGTAMLHTAPNGRSN